MSDTIQLGSIIEGKVVKIKPFGAIVLLPDNVQGLVHISHISSSFVQDIGDYVAVGDIVKVKVLQINDDNGRISLSMKEAQDEPKREEYHRNEPNSAESSAGFEDLFKDWVKSSNERQAGLNKRNKRR